MNETFVRESSVIAQPNGDTTVLFHMETGRYFSLNETGSRVWTLCDGTRTTEQIADAMSDEFEAPRDMLHDDIAQLLQTLLSRGLVNSVDGTA